MTLDDLTEEQEAVARHPGEAFVEACPGSGKTGTIIARLAIRAPTLPIRKGIALLSFTNSAVDEFKDRMQRAGLTALDAFPNYVGTFDGFILRYIFSPPGAPNCNMKPTVIDSWATLGREVRLRGNTAFRGPGVPLNLFDAATGHIDTRSIYRNDLRAHVTTHRAAYEAVASTMRANHHRVGLFSADCARIVAYNRIRDPDWGGHLGAALATRFAEIIVDEAQDCNPADLEIVTWLREAGIPVTLVCDLDQSIYSFRHGLPADLRDYQKRYNNKLRLTGNFRSSGAVCRLAATLRAEPQPDRPLGKTKDTPHPVLLLSFAGGIDSRIGHAFTECAQQLRIDPAGCMVLAHRRKAALQAVGDARAHEGGTSNIEVLARCVGLFNRATISGREREQALQGVERLLLELQREIAEDEHVGLTLERQRRDKRLLRRQALALVANLPCTCADNDAARTEWILRARGAIEALELFLPPDASIPRFLPNRQGDWHRHLEEMAARSIFAATVHEAKGREYEAVCIVMPPDRPGQTPRLTPLLEHWEARTDSEPKRVIYVGVTRAKQFVALAIPRAEKDRVAAVLQASEVPFEQLDV